jgi:hypothetical protein
VTTVHDHVIMWDDRSSSPSSSSLSGAASSVSSSSSSSLFKDDNNSFNIPSLEIDRYDRIYSGQWRVGPQCGIMTTKSSTSITGRPIENWHCRSTDARSSNYITGYMPSSIIEPWIRDIAYGTSCGVALRLNGSIITFGGNNFMIPPHLPLANQTFIAVCVQSNAACGILSEDKTVICWGEGEGNSAKPWTGKKDLCFFEAIC